MLEGIRHATRWGCNDHFAETKVVMSGESTLVPEPINHVANGGGRYSDEKNEGETSVLLPSIPE